MLLAFDTATPQVSVAITDRDDPERVLVELTSERPMKHGEQLAPLIDRALHEAGRSVPDDVSVIGFDDIPTASQFFPPLTTVRQPIHQIGRSAVNTLLARIAGLEPSSPQVILPTELILRASTAACRPRA